MKIKLLAATVLFFALGISTTQAQNRQRAKDQSSFEQKGQRGGGFSKDGKWDKSKKDGKFRKRNGKFKSEKGIKNRHRNEFRKDKKRSGFHKGHQKSH